MGAFDRELEFALDIARLGGRIGLGHFRRAIKTQQKADGTWVSEVDWAVEAQIRLRIARTFPEHNVLGEEEGLTRAGGGGALAGAPTWVIDPIDGTNNYIAGIPIWATLVALQVDGQNVVGVAHAPALNETYAAATGAGARVNDDTIHVAEADHLPDATLLFASVESFEAVGLERFFSELVRRSWRSRGFGDFWGHMLVARGAAHIMVEPRLAIWDVAALEPIVREAGGRLSHLDGTPWRDAGSCLTTNEALHDQVVTILRQHAPEWQEGASGCPPGVAPTV